MNQEVKQKLAGLADKLGVTVEHLWSVLVNQAFYSACWSMVSFFVLIGLLLACYKLAMFSYAKFIEKCNDDKAVWNDEEIAWMKGTVILALFGVVIGICILAEFLQFDRTLAGFYNPEYWAIKEIGDLL